MLLCACNSHVYITIPWSGIVKLADKKKLTKVSPERTPRVQPGLPSCISRLSDLCPIGLICFLHKFKLSLSVEYKNAVHSYVCMYVAPSHEFIGLCFHDTNINSQRSVLRRTFTKFAFYHYKLSWSFGNYTLFF